MTYFLVVGEASADEHAAGLIVALKAQDPEACFVFVGGEKMAAAAGAPPMVHYRHLAVMGFVDVFLNYEKIKKIANRVQQAMQQSHPDVVIPVDSGGFNCRYTLPFARSLGIPVVYYIPPKVWAWRRYRTKQLRRMIDMALVILPFEETFLRGRRVNAFYVGNPSVSSVRENLAMHSSKDLFCGRVPTVALLPGSRLSELQNNLSTMLQALKSFPDTVRGVIAGAPGLSIEDYASFLSDQENVSVEFGATHSILAQADVAFVTSGTATLEAALIGTPQVVCYKMRGGWCARMIFRNFFSIRYFSLVNLILDKEVVPELLADEMKPHKLRSLLVDLLNPTSQAYRAMKSGYKELRCVLAPQGDATPKAAHKAAQQILSLLALRSKDL